MFAALVLALASPIPSAPPLTAVTKCGNAAPSTYADVFGADLEDRALLRFIRILEAADGKIRAAATASARIPLAPEVTSSVATAVAAVPCAEGIVSAASARMAVAISQNWRVSNDADAERLTSRVQAIASALLARGTLAAAAVDGSIEPFGTTLEALDASAPLPEPCAPQTAAHLVRVAQPAYPLAARVARVTGKVKVKVELDEDGDVKRATIYNDDLPDAVGAASLREASLVAAATSLYAPELQNCKPVSGAYIFVAAFTNR